MKRSACLATKSIVFGIPSTSKANIEQYESVTNRWKDVHIHNLLGIHNFLWDPFNFAVTVSANVINENEAVLF